jgi:hypothetical protein
MSLSARASAEEPTATGVRTRVFISPSGEPFRSGAADTRPSDVWFARADANHDGVLTQAELEADAVAFFKTIDANHDGVVDGFEVSDYEQKIAPEILPRIARLTARDIPPLPARRSDGQPQTDQERFELPIPGLRRRPQPGGAMALGLTREPEPVAAADTDFDGKVSRAEMLAAARRHFATLDLDHDGRIPRTELPSTPAELIAEKAERKHKPPPH